MTDRAPTRGVRLTALLACVAAVLLGVGAAAADPTVEQKRAQAQSVLEQIRELDSRLSHTIEAYNLANVRMQRIERDLRQNGRHLVIARSSLEAAEVHLSQRLVALYVEGGDASALEVLLGAESLDDLLARIDAAERVSQQDTRVLREIRTFKAEVIKRKAKLKKARAAQNVVVAERARQRRSVEGQLAERQRMLEGIKDEIARIQAAERRQQARLAAQAAARLASSRRDPGSVNALSEPSSFEQPSTPVPPSRYGGVVGIAMQYLGIPYVWGGSSPAGFDCSGFVMYVYAQVGVSLPHNAAMQFGHGTPVSRDQLEPGDLVFFDGLGHNGIYIGGSQFIHSPHTGDVVKISSLYDSWYDSRWVGGRRL